ncbi:Unknown protein, partial [Striga hermonthica]
GSRAQQSPSTAGSARVVQVCAAGTACNQYPLRVAVGSAPVHANTQPACQHAVTHASTQRRLMMASAAACSSSQCCGKAQRTPAAFSCMSARASMASTAPSAVQQPRHALCMPNRGQVHAALSAMAMAGRPQRPCPHQFHQQPRPQPWQAGLEFIFEVMDCPDRYRVVYAQLQLTGDARLWWNAYWSMRPGEKAGCTWDMLKELVREKYYPSYYWAEMERQFLALQQGTRTVDEYEREFTRLAAF